jgi:hypothetical protein
VQCPAGDGQHLAEPLEVDRVVGVAAVSRAAPPRDQPGIAQLAQVVRDEALGLPHQVGQLVHRAVAAGQAAQQPPAQRVPRQLQERWCIHNPH